MSKYNNYMCCMESFFSVTELAWDCGLISLIRMQDIFFLGMLKGEVYNNKPYMEDDKK
jgi:hypothetical protein